MSYKKIKSILFALFCAVFSTAAWSAERTYDVQVLIFSHLTPQTVSAEQWPILSDTQINAFSNNKITSANSAYGLQSEIKTLQNNPDYQVLYSGSWKETWSGDNTSVSIPFSNNNNLQGRITIVLGHYFDVHANLLFSTPTAALQKLDTSGYFNHISQSTFYFSLSQDRRMRSRELNYLSEPVLGMIIKMIPMQ